ncbi:unnamed protein product [Arctogadus glacialis]
MLHHQEACLVAHSSRSSVASASGASVNSASSMDSLDRVLRFAPSDANHSLATPPPEGTNQGPASTEHSYLDSETSLILKNMAGKPSHLLTKVTPPPALLVTFNPFCMSQSASIPFSELLLSMSSVCLSVFLPFCMFLCLHA